MNGMDERHEAQSMLFFDLLHRGVQDMTLEEIIKIKYHSLNENDLYIWRYISENKQVCSKLTIEELGKRCNVSRTTILRFAKKLELEGYSELKYYLRQEHQADDSGLMQKKTIDLDPILVNYNIMLQEMKNKNLIPVCEMIDKAERIIIAGSGNVQHLMARELQRAFLRANVVMTVINGRAEMESIPRWIKTDDLVILISLSGENEEINDLAKVLRIKGVGMISITRMASNSLSRLADEPIYVFSESVSVEGSYVYMSVTMFFSLIEILFIRYYNYKKLQEEGPEICS